jgi:hypothetical protein
MAPRLASEYPPGIVQAIGFGLLIFAAWLTWQAVLLGFAATTENAVVSSEIGASATTYGRSEDVWIIRVVITELEFRDVQRQIFATSFAEAAHDTALQQRRYACNLEFHGTSDAVLRWLRKAGKTERIQP